MLYPSSSVQFESQSPFSFDSLCKLEAQPQAKTIQKKKGCENAFFMPIRKGEIYSHVPAMQEI